MTFKTFNSFEQALHICMTAEQDSKEQDEAILYCLEYAPANLKDKLQGIMRHKLPKHNHDCSCGVSTTRNNDCEND